jgi:hypothetical protein
MRLFGLVLFFLYFGPACLACEIKLYAGQEANQSSSTFNLVFCSLNYQNQAEFIFDTGILMQRLRSTPPFDEFDDFLFWSIYLSGDEEEDIFFESHGLPPVKIRLDFLERISAELRQAYKLIIIDAAGFISCAELSEIQNTSLVILGRKRYENADSFAKGFLHELGHSLGLRDECTHCQQLSPAGYPNCAATREEAVQWWGDLVGKDDRVNYIAGCSGNKNYIRPTIASLMNDPDKATDFGPVNERYLRNILKDYRSTQ